MKLKNKTIVVTGASDGIGKQIALRLAKEKTNLILVGRNKVRLSAVCNSIKKKGVKKCRFYSCDLRKTLDVKEVIQNISQDYSKIDGLINNAGVWHNFNSLEKISDQEILDVIQINLSSLIILTKYLLPMIKKSNQAAIINVSSRLGYSVQKNQSAYIASKYGVRGFTESLRKELKDANIHVAGIYPDGVKTKIFEKSGAKVPNEIYEQLISSKEIAEIITFMLSRPKNTWLSEVKISNS